MVNCADKTGLMMTTLITIMGMNSAAYAQSSVTLYGILDTGVAYIRNSDGKSTQVAMTPAEVGPRWGLKGTEDLGGEVRAIFALENGFSVGTGQQSSKNLEFGRSAYAGLSSDTYGTLTVGRQYDPITDQIQPLTADYVIGPISASPGDVDNYDDSARFSNTVKWASPLYRGFEIETMYRFGGVAGALGSRQTWSAALGYHTGPMAIAAGYIHIDNGNSMFSLRDIGSSDSLFNSPVNDGYATAKSINIVRVAAEYVANGIQAGAAYSFSTYNRDAASTFANNEEFQNGSVFTAYRFAPPLVIGLGYNYTRALGDTSAKYHSFQIGATYGLSKTTFVYVLGVFMHALGEQRDPSGELLPAQAVIGSFDIASGASTQSMVILGMRHTF